MKALCLQLDRVLKRAKFQLWPSRQLMLPLEHVGDESPVHAASASSARRVEIGQILTGQSKGELDPMIAGEGLVGSDVK
jgi:hypothetical protein